LNKAFTLGPTAIVTLVLMKIEFQAKEGVLFNNYSMCAQWDRPHTLVRLNGEDLYSLIWWVGSEKYLCCKMIGWVGS
jgi:hypothetical protein